MSFCFSNGEDLLFIIDVKSLWPSLGTPLTMDAKSLWSSLDTVCFSSEIVLDVTE